MELLSGASAVKRAQTTSSSNTRSLLRAFFPLVLLHQIFIIYRSRYPAQGVIVSCQLPAGDTTAWSTSSSLYRGLLVGECTV